MGGMGFLGGLFDSLQPVTCLTTSKRSLPATPSSRGCKQVCYDMAFPISQLQILVFHIVLIATPSLVFLMYAMHHNNKRTIQDKTQVYREELRLGGFYMINVAFRYVGRNRLFGGPVGAVWIQGGGPVPMVDISDFQLCRIFYGSIKWFCCSSPPTPELQNLDNYEKEERTVSESLRGSMRHKGGTVRSNTSRKSSNIGQKQGWQILSSKAFMV
ncbi:hypothetical protein KUCAC02_027502 [Chaenocephalus aceratus]|uniref:Uncharacterized protein n=1 Tax=Chaenocephalus aceratus TaxID=36190 RepID=A0ACB9W4K3_CHAAC|nr:hypothetical protein KUCAC02_027502 [Chaenocephalus aceratus]